MLNRIREVIHERGPITFAEYMLHALYGPGGFYERPPIGTSGHFVTSPHVHPVFSRLVGVAIEELWLLLGRPVPFPVVEVGAGDGALARELVRGFARGRVKVSYMAVELSAGARTALSAIGGVRVAAALGELDPIDGGVVVANELLDNLPFRRVRMREEPMEVRIGLEGDRLVEAEVPCGDELSELLPGLDPGEEVTVPVGALAFVDELATHLSRGYALLIDYGTLEGRGGVAHGYRGHRVLDDILDDPGGADITAGVNLGVVVRRAEERRLAHLAPVPQWAALVALGFEGWARSELERQTALLESGHGLDAVRAWEGRGRARLLVDPGALGALRWLVFSTPGLPEPPWVERARAVGTDRPPSASGVE